MQLRYVAKTSVRHSLYLIDKICQGSISGFDIDEFCDLMLSEMNNMVDWQRPFYIINTFQFQHSMNNLDIIGF